MHVPAGRANCVRLCATRCMYMQVRKTMPRYAGPVVREPLAQGMENAEESKAYFNTPHAVAGMGLLQSSLQGQAGRACTTGAPAAVLLRRLDRGRQRRPSPRRPRPAHARPGTRGQTEGQASNRSGRAGTPVVLCFHMACSGDHLESCLDSRPKRAKQPKATRLTINATKPMAAGAGRSPKHLMTATSIHNGSNKKMP